MCQGLNHFFRVFTSFFLAKLATSSIRVRLDCKLIFDKGGGIRESKHLIRSYR